MQFSGRLTILWTFSAVILSTVLLLGGQGRATAATDCTTAGLHNPGFEDGLACWTAVVYDSVEPTDTDTAAEYPAYATAPGGPYDVSPKLGMYMARLGTPRAINANQPTGMNSISQTFIPTEPSLTLYAKLFSWESRGEDTFKLSVSGGATFQAFSFGTVPNEVTCGAGSSCSPSIDVGKTNDFLGSKEWVPIVINFPARAAGSAVAPVTITFEVGSTKSASHASWLYLDNSNTPPVAEFDFVYPKLKLSPDGVPTGPVEGIAIGLRDNTSYDPDPGDRVVAWEWNIKGPGLPLDGITSRNQNPFFVPPRDGLHTVRLTVTDTFGATGSIVKSREVVNAPPLVNAPDMEVIADKAFTVEGRFSDGGWKDTHTAAWTNGLTGSGLEEDGKAMVTSGIARATGAPVTSNGVGTLTIADDGGASGSDRFDVTVVAASDTERFEPNDAIAPASPLPATPILTVDGSYLSFLQSANDKDVYEIRWPGGQDGQPGPSKSIPAGAEVLITLKELPADYDLILVAVPPEAQAAGYEFSGFEFSGGQLNELPSFTPTGYEFSGYEFSGYEFSSISRTGYEFSGYEFSGYEFSGFEFSGYEFSGYEFSGYEFSGYEFSGYEFSPISQMGYTNLDASSISPSDISLGQLGLGALPPGATVVSYSANRGTLTEAVLTRVDVPGTKLYAVIVGSNASYSHEPYRLQVEGSVSLLAAALAADGGDAKFAALAGASCTAAVMPALDFTPSIPGGYGGAPHTLFVMQADRLAAKGSETDWTAFSSSMNNLALHDDVKGAFLNIDPGVYASLNASPCDVNKANDVSSALRDTIQAQLKLTQNSSIRYVVILGDDDVIPFRRVPDETTISNERYYLSSSFLKPGTPLFASVAGGYNLTDDCYVDAQPTPWQGRELCIPDLIVSRMVETPLEIAAQADTFLLPAVNGQLDMSTGTAFVSGYDFFEDGSTAVADALDVVYALVGNLIGEDWTADDLRCSLGIPSVGCPTGGPAPTVSDVNAHFTHYAGLSANGFKTGDNSDVLKGTDIGQGTFVGRLIFTIGCHAGFSMPGSSASAADPALGINTALDFAQAFAQERAVFVASTGFGLGDNAGIGGTEKLLVYYAEELTKDKSVGQALVDAKRRYLSSLTAASVYDEKSSINLTLYGLPMYHRPDVVLSDTVSLTASAEALSGAAIPVSGPITVPGAGSYYTAVGGDASAPPYRPLQPRFTEVLPPATTADSVHGVLWTGGDFHQVASNVTSLAGFDPVIVRPRTEWESSVQEPQVCYKSFWPSELFRVNTLNGRNGLEQTLVITPGQFRCDGLDSNGKIYGTQRIFDNLEYTALRSGSDDVIPPDVNSVSASRTAGGVTLEISASDPVITNATTSNITRMVVLRVTETSAASPAGEVTVLNDFPVTPAVQSGVFNVPIADPGNDSVVIQVVDAAGNVGVYSAKGAGLRILTVNLGADKEFVDGQTLVFNAAVTGGSGDATYFWDFGEGPDGTTATTSTSTISHVFSPSQLEYAVKVKVVDANGGIGSDTVIVRYYCRDTRGDAPVPPDPSLTLSYADFVGCAATINGSAMTITLRMAGPVEPAGAFTGTRYTISTAVGGTTKNLNYKDGSWTGVKSLAVSTSGNNVVFTFDPKDIGLTPGKTMTWFAETQDGIPSTTGAGSLDRMKDVGSFSYAR